MPVWMLKELEGTKIHHILDIVGRYPLLSRITVEVPCLNVPALEGQYCDLEKLFRAAAVKGR